ncbi:MAG: hypothetical protein ACFCU4_06810 [Puniceicoccaceae bacterium]
MISHAMVEGALRRVLTEIKATPIQYGHPVLSGYAGGIWAARKRLPELTVHSVYHQNRTAIDHSFSGRPA